MERDDFAETMGLINNEIAAIIHWQRVLGGVKRTLGRKVIAPFEEDLIYRDHYGEPSSEPRIHRVDGFTFTSQILHRQGLRQKDIAGADLLYEIRGRKYVLIQYKLADRRSARVRRTPHQMTTLLNNCPDVCMYNIHKKKDRPLPFRLNGFCGCWYRVDSGSKSRYVHACEAERIYGLANSANFQEFDTGLPRQVFDRLFASCRIGALIGFEQAMQARDYYIDLFTEYAHMIFQIVQQPL